MSSQGDRGQNFLHLELVQEISKLIHQRTGIQLGEKQVAMVESRLKRRSYEVGLTGLDDYVAFFAANRDTETEALISLLTTHHTFFFREFVQFEFLQQKLPELVHSARSRGSKTLEVYSAACSRGQEVYSLAMFLDRHLKECAPDFDYKILGSDVDGASVEVAGNGVYRREEIKSAPLAYLGDHWARGTGEISEFVKAKKSLRSHCEFAKVNLLDLGPLAKRKFDVIFCRNVFIYFTPPQIKKIAHELLAHLHSGGLFFVGVSETLNSLDLALTAVGSSVYSARKSAPATPKAPELRLVPPVKAAATPAMPNPLRVVCVDDSASIITLLSRVLSRDHGFEVVGTAANGKEAEEVIAKLKPDVVTLDIHMPVRTGIEFLEQARAKGLPLPPVVMVTSVSRDDADLAWKALKSGAADYVEKPALQNLEQRAEEIRSKLRTAYRAKGRPVKASLDQQFKRPTAIPDPALCAAVMILSMGDLDRCVPVLRDLMAGGVPTYLAMEGADSLLPAVAERLTRDARCTVSSDPSAVPTKAAAVIGPLGTLLPLVKGKGSVAAMVFGEISKSGAAAVTKLSGACLILEDLGGGVGASHLAELASEVVAATSFAYLCVDFFAKSQARKKIA